MEVLACKEGLSQAMELVISQAIRDVDTPCNECGGSYELS